MDATRDVFYTNQKRTRTTATANYRDNNLVWSLLQQVCSAEIFIGALFELSVTRMTHREKP